MKRGFITVGMLLAACSAAHAADPAAAPLSANWQGLYVGLHGGVAGDEFKFPGSYSDLGDTVVSGSASLNSSGLFGGAQAGFNVQTAPNWLFGIEADISAANIEGMLNIGGSAVFPVTGSASASAGSKVDWFGTLRGRLGWITGPVLLYGTGGLAFGETESSYNVTWTGQSTPLAGSKSDTNTGWTVGAGIEYAVSPNLSLKTEYKYVDLGSSNLLTYPFGGSEVVRIDAETHFHTLAVGFNYRFDGHGAGAAPPPVATDWRGFYVGVQGGFGGDQFEYPVSVVDSGTTLISGSASQNSSGFFGGVTAGYNFPTASNWLIGLEADLAATNIEGKLGLEASSSGPSGSVSLGSKVDWFGTLRARAGWIYGPILLYGTGGLAYGQTTASVDANVMGYGTGLSTSNTSYGWTAGAGFEYALAPNISLKTEYKYVDLGSGNLFSFGWPDGGVAIDDETRFQTVQVGLNYRF